MAAPLMAAYVLGYAATHPLRFDASFDGGDRVYPHEAGKVVRYTLKLENTGSATVGDLQVVRTEGSPALQLDRAFFPSGNNLEEGDYDDFTSLALRQGRSCPTPFGRLEAIWLRYTVLGMEHEQRVPLVDGPSVRCR